ncbi:hypothetical protein CTheo_1089 [Ceratobasidium theobromae]|uniref:Uncharacterized protein n=1 Tax=Ceratobasidium theobromae TaxID=1582974 RepID=A0A5N5QUH3_9AGAM|nr:hypothetical protein CTheo_1089 [Ceratobasidium theobromae]
MPAQAKLFASKSSPLRRILSSLTTAQRSLHSSASSLVTCHSSLPHSSHNTLEMEVATDIIPGDIVAVNVDHGRREGLVVGHHYDALGRHIVEVQLEGYPSYYHAWYPTVTRIRRTTTYHQPAVRYRHVDRHVYY